MFITKLCGTDNILGDSHIMSECGKSPRIFNGMLLVPRNTVMDMNNVMVLLLKTPS